MKKVLCSIVCALCMLQLSAQNYPNITNPGFEDWSGLAPTGWTTSLLGDIVNINTKNPNFNYFVQMEFGTKTTDAHSGNYALKLQANTLTPPQGPRVTMPGVAQVGTASEFVIDYSIIEPFMVLDSFVVDWGILELIGVAELGTVANIFSKGVPFNMVPTAVKAWVKFIPQEGVSDTMSVWVGASRAGDPVYLMWGDVPSAGHGYAEYSNRMDEYTEITIPLEYSSDNIYCDSLQLIFVSTSIRAPKEETLLYIDDISFEFDYTSVRSDEKISMKLYPNPATDYMVLSLENQTDLYDVTLYDINGKQIRQLKSLTGNTRLAVDDLSAGTYFLKVQQSGNTTVRKFVVE